MGLFTDGFKELKKASEPLYKSPKSIQETIEIMAVAENGIFEVARNRYSKCYLFQDINYTTTNEDEQIDIFERYCKFLNSLDCNYKITVNNKNKNMAELREKVMFPKKDDGFDEYRQAYNDIIEEEILTADRGLNRRDTLHLRLSVRTLKRQRHSLPLWKPPFTRHLMSLEQRLFLLPVIRDLRFSMIFTILEMRKNLTLTLRRQRRWELTLRMTSVME